MLAFYRQILQIPLRNVWSTFTVTVFVAIFLERCSCKFVGMKRIPGFSELFCL